MKQRDRVIIAILAPIAVVMIVVAIAFYDDYADRMRERDDSLRHDSEIHKNITPPANPTGGSGGGEAVGDLGGGGRTGGGEAHDRNPFACEHSCSTICDWSEAEYNATVEGH